jgi:hypothetical protein
MHAAPTATVEEHAAQRLLPYALLVYTAASLLHFAHNATYLAAYPNLPQSWVASQVWLAWCAVSAFALAGYLLWRATHRRAGLALLALYACCGFAGLLHYQRAGFHRHTAMMNLTILTEVVAALLLLTDVALLARRGRFQT